MGIERVGVIGAGTMGSGIAQVMALAGCQITVVDVALEPLERGLGRIRQNLSRAVEKGSLRSAEAEQALARLATALKLDALAEVDLVVEAASEDYGTKAKVFQDLDQLCKADALLASNTSSISITRLGANTKRPERVIGMHFFNPVPRMKLVEVVRGFLTADQTFEAIAGLARRLGKTPVEVRDFPGFVANRLLVPFINEAAYALMEGVATREAIDEVTRLGLNHPMGPLELADLIGLDVVVAISRVLEEGLGAKYHPCPLLEQMVAAGYLGRKTGRGFYIYQ